MESEGEGTAVVVGAGIAGLLAAHVACKHFPRVILIERDLLEDDGLPTCATDANYFRKCRRGVLQFHHPHLLMPGGLHAFEKLLPGFGEQLCQHGGVPLDVAQSYIYDFGVLKFREASSIKVVGASRGLLERVLRMRIAAESGGRLVMRGGTKVEGLIWSKDSVAVAGVRVAGGGAVPTALVIDASGRYSRLPLWLEEGGWGRPRLRSVDSRLCYTSCTVCLPEGWAKEEGVKAAAAAEPAHSKRNGSSEPGIAGPWPTIISVRQRPWGLRGGTLMPQEHGTAAVLQYGYNGEQAPTDQQGWLDFAASLPDPALHTALLRCKVISPIVKYAGLRDVLRCYHEIQMPAGIVAVGDSVAELNPINAQGMTVAAVDALVLDTALCRALGSTAVTAEGTAGAAGTAGGAAVDAISGQDQQEGLRSLAETFQRELFEAMSPAWGSCCMEDTRYPCARAEGVSRPPWHKAAYAHKLSRAALRHRPTMELNMAVAHLELPASTLYTPRVAWQIAKQAARDVWAGLLSSLWGRAAPILH